MSDALGIGAVLRAKGALTRQMAARNKAGKRGISLASCGFSCFCRNESMPANRFYTAFDLQEWGS
ncbi:MAG: hypothetical protein ABI273_14620, partial [Lacunisphaera sp.]